MRELPDELWDHWGRAYQFICVMSPSPHDVSVMERFQSQAGITDRLIVYLITQAIKRRRRNYLSWVAEVLTECAANGITTQDEWVAFDKEREAGDKDGRGTGRSGPTDSKASGSGTGRERGQAGSNDGGAGPKAGNRQGRDLNSLSL